MKFDKKTIAGWFALLLIWWIFRILVGNNIPSFLFLFIVLVSYIIAQAVNLQTTKKLNFNQPINKMFILILGSITLLVIAIISINTAVVEPENIVGEYQDVSELKELDYIIPKGFDIFKNEKPAIEPMLIERLVVEKINSAREKNGRNALVVDTLLSKASRFYSKDMFERDFFDYTNPDGEGLTDVAIKYGVDWDLEKYPPEVYHNIARVPFNDEECGGIASNLGAADCIFDLFDVKYNTEDVIFDETYTILGLGIYSTTEISNDMDNGGMYITYVTG